MNLIIKGLLVVMSFLSIYFHYLNNISSQIQSLIYEDIYNGVYREESTYRFQALNLDFPNLSLSSLPMKAVIGRYYFLGAQYEKALELASDGMIDNPYIMYAESLKADVFFKLGVKDSIIYYSEKAYTGIPNNHKHFIDISRAYINFDKYHLLDSVFQKVESKNNSEIWKYYLSALLTKEDSVTDYGKIIAKEALKKYPDTQNYRELRLSATYVLYGRERIEKSIETNQRALQLFDEEKFREAALNFEEAARLNPVEFSHFENAGISNFKFGYYEKSIPFFKQVIDSMNPGTGKSEFVLAQAYAELGDLENACKYINDSSKFDYRDSFRLIGEYCKD